MSYLARLLGRDSRRGRAPARFHLEALESRALLSQTGLPAAAPTIITLQKTATSAESGQNVPLVATIKTTGAVPLTKKGKAKPIEGKVEFYVNSPDPVVLGTVKVNSKNAASLSTNKLTTVGPYDIVAQFMPSDTVYAASTSAPLPLSITPQTLNAPTVTTLQLTSSTFETGQLVSFNASVQNSNSSLPDGTIKLTTLSRHPIALGEQAVSNFGQPVNFGTYKLEKVGVYHVRAEYVPSTNRFAKSISAPVTVLVTPLTAASFRVTPLVRHGKLNKPVSFAVTAVNAHGHPVTDYTGTVVFTSPTDSWTTFPPSVYANLHISAPPPQSTGLADFAPRSYTFTTADQGSHTFFGGVTFGKAGAENIKVTQANNPKVVGRTTFAIE
jgi:Bacterial Ig-like domain (group 3)